MIPDALLKILLKIYYEKGRCPKIMMLCYRRDYGRSLLDDAIQMTIKPEWFDHPIIREAMLEIEHVYKIEGLAFYSSD